MAKYRMALRRVAVFKEVLVLAFARRSSVSFTNGIDVDSDRRRDEARMGSWNAKAVYSCSLRL